MESYGLNVVHNYPRLQAAIRNDNWFIKKIEQQHGRVRVENGKSYLTQVPLCSSWFFPLVLNANFNTAAFTLSLNNVDAISSDRLAHTPEGTNFNIFEMNVQQGGFQAIPDLYEANDQLHHAAVDPKAAETKKLIAENKMNIMRNYTYHSMKKVNGITYSAMDEKEYKKLCAASDIFHIATQMASANKQIDEEKNRDNNYSANDIIQQFFQHVICPYTLAPLSIQNGTFRISL